MKVYKAKQRIFNLDDSIYCQDIRVIVGDEDYFKKWLKKNNIKYEEQKFYAETGEVNMGTHDMFYVRLRCFGNTPLDMATAIHELLHVTFRVFNNIGFKFDYDNTEPMNYYLEMLAKDFYIKIFN